MMTELTGKCIDFPHRGGGLGISLGRTIWFLIAAIAVLLPVLLFALNGADFTWVSSESLAYRFFYSARLYRATDLTAWLPQGQLITSIQHGINYYLLRGYDGSLESLRSTLNTFCYATLVVIDAIMIGVLACAALARMLTWYDRAALLVVALSLYTSAGTVLYALWPDYLYLDAALMTLSVFLFQWFWRGMPFGNYNIAAFGTGAFVGLLAANKVSMATLGIPLVTTVLFANPLRMRHIAQRMVLAIIGAVIALGLVLWVASLFRIDWLISVSQSWYKFVTNPGGEPGFSQQIWSPLYFGCAVMVLWWVSTFVLVVYQLDRHTVERAKLAAVAAIVVSSFACALYVWKRPAATTLWESCASLLAFSAMLLTLAKRSQTTNSVVAGLLGCMGVAVLIARPDLPIRWWSSHSRVAGDEQWRFFQEATKLVPQNGIRYFIPNNHYQAGDVFIILLKGASNVLTWNVSNNGQWILDKFAPGLEFVIGSPPDPYWTKKMPGDSVMVWFDFPGLQRIPELSPSLAEALARPGVETTTRGLPTARVDGHIARLPTAGM